MKKIFTFSMVAFIVLTSNSFALKKKSDTKFGAGKTMSQAQLKSAAVADMADSSAFFIWQTNKWRLLYSSSYEYQDNLEVQNLSYFYSSDEITVDYVTRTSMSYDNMDRLTQEVSQVKNGDEFENQSRYRYSYYGNTDMTTLMISESWNGSDWSENGRMMTRYDEKGNATSYINSMSFSGVTLINSGDSSLYEYNGDNILFETYYEYESQGLTGIWSPYEKWIYTWNGNVVTSAIYLEYENEQWVEKEKYVDLQWSGPGGFDLNMEPTSYKIQGMGSGVWSDSLRVTNTFDGAIQTRIEQRWENDSWVNQFKEAFDYMANDDTFGEYLEYSWNETMSDWELTDGSRFLNEYEKSALEGRLISTTLQFYDNALDEWESTNKTEYYYEGTTDIKFIDVEQTVTMYPIPSSGQLNLQFNNTITSAKIKIYNVSGALVYIENIESPANGMIYTRNLDYLKKGLYVLQLEMPDKTQTLKFILK